MLIRNSFKCLVCGEGIDKGELICEECKGTEALDLVKLICRTEIVLPKGWEMVSLYEDRIAFSEFEDRYIKEPYVIWNIDFKGDVYGGNYFNNRKSAEECYFNKLLNMI